MVRPMIRHSRAKTYPQSGVVVTSGRHDSRTVVATRGRHYVLPRPLYGYLLASLLLALTPTCQLRGEPAAAPAASLEDTLVATYNSWRASMIAGDYPAWRKHTAAYRRVVTRNNIISQKLKFPDALFAVPLQPASIAGLKPIQAIAVRHTAQLVFYGRIDVGLELPEGTELPENLLILKFIREGSVWKFNTLSLLNLNGADVIKKQLAKKDYDFLNQGNFVPPGFVPPVPAECPFPDYVAQIQITSFGYDTVVTINGVSTHQVSDTATSELVIGGLKKTPNSITITSKPIDAPESDDPEENEIPKKLEVTVYALPNKEGGRAHKAWDYQPARVLPSYRGMFFAMPR